MAKKLLIIIGVVAILAIAFGLGFWTKSYIGGIYLEFVK